MNILSTKEKDEILRTLVEVYSIRSTGRLTGHNRDTIMRILVDAGNPGCPLVSEPNDPNNVRINIGAYGGKAEASRSTASWCNKLFRRTFCSDSDKL